MRLIFIWGPASQRRFPPPTFFPYGKFIDLGQGGKPTWGVAVGTQHIQAAARWQPGEVVIPVVCMADVTGTGMLSYIFMP